MRIAIVLLLCTLALAGCAEPDESDLDDVGEGTTTERPWTGSTGTGTNATSSPGATSGTTTGATSTTYAR